MLSVAFLFLGLGGIVVGLKGGVLGRGVLEDVLGRGGGRGRGEELSKCHFACGFGVGYSSCWHKHHHKNRSPSCNAE